MNEVPLDILLRTFQYLKQPITQRMRWRHFVIGAKLIIARDRVPCGNREQPHHRTFSNNFAIFSTSGHSFSHFQPSKIFLQISFLARSFCVALPTLVHCLD